MNWFLISSLMFNLTLGCDLALKAYNALVFNLTLFILNLVGDFLTLVGDFLKLFGAASGMSLRSAIDLRFALASY